jgi:DNA-binding CsgD family transcriptional regulator
VVQTHTRAHLLAGGTPKEIAQVLGVPPPTVCRHRARIFTKTGRS